MPVRDEGWVEHASGLNFNSKYPSIYLLDYSSQPTDETGGKDSKIYGDSVNSNYGTSTSIDVIMTETNLPRRGLVEFDLSSITANSTVSAATFSLWTDTGYSNLSTAIHRLTAEWTESEVTWKNRKTGTAWSSAGGDFDGSADATATPSSTSAGTKTDWNVASLVQEWVNGTANYGMLIKLVSESGSGSNKGHRFRSSATTTNNTEPKLVATYASISPSPSLSPSASQSPSSSPSASQSPSASPSASESRSPSLSPSASQSPSSSISASPSSSVSPSPSTGYTDYTRGNYAALPTNDNDLETAYSAGDVTDVSSKNDVYVDQSATNGFMIHQFKEFVGEQVACQVEVEARSTLGCNLSTTYLQIYNHTSGDWDTIDSDNSTAADTDFSLISDVADLTDYKDSSNVISCRVYQEAV